MILQLHFSQEHTHTYKKKPNKNNKNTTSSVSAQLSAAANTIYQILFSFLSYANKICNPQLHIVQLRSTGKHIHTVFFKMQDNINKCPNVYI